MGLDLDYTDGQTPLDEDEKDGLLMSTITTRGELNEFEQLGVEKAIEWTMKRKLGLPKNPHRGFCKGIAQEDV